MENNSAQEDNSGNDPVTTSPTQSNLHFKIFPFKDQKTPLFLLVFTGLLFYCTSLYNEYALDDGIIIHQNAYVLKGVSGIKDILTKDAYHSFYKRMCAKDQLQGGRYRPLPIISYAIEQEFIGPYRAGTYYRCDDLDHNGVLDHGKVYYENGCGDTEFDFEYNHFEDSNQDHQVQSEECFSCWDLNRNFKNEPGEDLNNDGIFNEVDCQVNGAPLRHLTNMLLYILACVMVYLLFSHYLFKNNQDVAFLAALIYLIHPVHSEVVANIKGRDEIMSVLFIALTFIFMFRFIATKSKTSLTLGALFFLFALLSKEYAIILFVLVPLATYTFTDEKIKFNNLALPLVLFAVLAGYLIALDIRGDYSDIAPKYWYLGALVFYLTVVIITSKKLIQQKSTELFMIAMFYSGLVYLTLRVNAVNMGPGVEDTELLNNPFLIASGKQELATKLVVLFNYFKLSLFPHPLVADYSYATFAYPDFSDWRCLAGALVYTLLFAAAIWLSVKKHALGFALFTYLLFIIMVSNLFFHTGLVMLESYLFHATLGTAIVLAWALVTVFEKLNWSLIIKRNVLVGVLLILLFLCGMKTWERNFDWKNDVTLFLKDVKNAPNSVLVLGNAGARWIDLADTKEITGIALPGMENVKPNDYNGTLKISDEELKQSGYKTKREAALMKGIGYLKHAVELHPKYVNGYLNLGLAWYKLGNDKKTVLYWKLAERLYPNNPYLSNYYTVYCNQLQSKGMEAFNKEDYKKSLYYYNLWAIVKPNDYDPWYNLGAAYLNAGSKLKAKECWEKARIIEPNREGTQEVLNMLRDSSQVSDSPNTKYIYNPAKGGKH